MCALIPCTESFAWDCCSCRGGRSGASRMCSCSAAAALRLLLLLTLRGCGGGMLLRLVTVDVVAARLGNAGGVRIAMVGAVGERERFAAAAHGCPIILTDVCAIERVSLDPTRSISCPSLPSGRLFMRAQGVHLPSPSTVGSANTVCFRCLFSLRCVAQTCEALGARRSSICAAVFPYYRAALGPPFPARLRLA